VIFSILFFPQSRFPSRIVCLYCWKGSEIYKKTMQVVLHTGVHATDSDRLLKTLLRNREALRPAGVAIPGPGKYRKLISEMLNALGSDDPVPGARDVLIDSILDEDPAQVDRLVLSHENLFSVPKIAFQGGAIYRRAEQRLQAMQKVFAEDALEIFISVRNPATFLPALLSSTPHESLEALLQGMDLAQLRWADLVARVTGALPDVPVTVWCDEDSPLIWGEVVRELAGLEPGYPIIGAYSRMADIMTQDGMERFRAYLADRPDVTEVQVRRIMVAFLDKYADPDKIEDELDIPGWTDQVVEDLTEIYEEDMFELGRLPGVTLIAP
jgi:hypothetical protein